ncbi:aminotransferase class I/II-fold pyridoxal phosphate-dependent enzyme [Paenarthrobacter ureafaciens]
MRTATLSKALGSQGGAVLGSEPLREHLLNRARSFIFDTALAPPAAAAALTAVGIIRDEPWRPEAVHRNAAALTAGLSPPSAAAERSPGAVQSIPMVSAEAAVQAREGRAAGGCARGVLPPAVGSGRRVPAPADRPRNPYF